MRRLLFMLYLSGALACSPRQQAHEDTPPTKPAQTPEPAPEVPPGPHVPDEPLPEPPDEPDPPDGPPQPDDPDQLQARALIFAPGPASWRKVGQAPDALAFVYLAAGVLGRSGDTLYSLADTGGLTPLELEPPSPASPLTGYWPDDAIFVETTREKQDGAELTRLSFMRPKPDVNGWERLRVLGEDTSLIDEGQVLGKSWRGGYLVGGAQGWARIGGDAPAPKLGQTRYDELIAVFETETGELYTAQRGPTPADGVWVQPKCQDAKCVGASAKRLPRSWIPSFAIDASRGDDLSIIVDERQRGTPRRHLLHADDGQWSLETPDPGLGLPRAMWPTGEGGLWLACDGALLYRDPSGSAWRRVALPRGLKRPSFAMTRDRQELWVVGRVDARSIVFAISALP